jgi:Do/DeqQ family serine protease
VRAGLALAAVVVVAAGVAWQDVAGGTQAAAPQASGAANARTAEGARSSYADIVKVVAPAVVTVRTEGRARLSRTGFQDDEFFGPFFGDPFDRGPARPAPRQRGLGSGVIVTADGYILTNHHVVDGAETIRVELSDRRTHDARLVGSDEPSDLALLKVQASGLKPLSLGDSDAVEVGDVVLAIGNPLGIGQTVTMGIVSAKGRSTGIGDGSYEDFLQTDAPINQGNSGGALVSTKGELVGINSQILSVTQGNIGIGFAIPSNMARHVMDELRAEGRVRRAQLGVTVQPVTSDMAASLGLDEISGAIVSSVTAGSAADRAGLARGDVITSFNGQPVSDTNSLRNRVAAAEPGSNATVVVLRDGKERTVSVRLDEAAASRAARRGGDPEGEGSTALGVSVAPLTPELAARARVPRDVQGLIVQDVTPDSRAAAAGIQPGDVIVEVNRKPVQSIDDLRAAVRATTDRPLLLLVNRAGKDLFIAVRN